ncbi:MAG: electron transport complex subunit RsxE [Lysobacterales bacterium]|nr:MAG: electron transport complex subunit RsxE [Xanthomonadales bacterium]
MSVVGVVHNGVFEQNPGVVQLLGLCPLLAVSTSVSGALGLGLATLAVLVSSNGLAAVVGPRLPREIRLAVFVIVIGALVTAVELAMAGWWPGLHATLGIFLPLIVTNCLVLARAEAFASREPIGRAVADGFGMGLGFLLVLVALGASRELLANGTLGAGLSLLAGGGTASAGWRLVPEGHGLLLALLPPGAFLLLGLMLAGLNARAARRRRPEPTAFATPPVAESRR